MRVQEGADTGCAWLVMTQVSAWETVGRSSSSGKPVPHLAKVGVDVGHGTVPEVNSSTGNRIGTMGAVGNRI